MKNMNQNDLKRDRTYAQILKVKISITSKERVLMMVSDFLALKRKFYLLTANPELLVMAQRDENLKEVINRADLVVPDGVGLKLAVPKLVIVKGRELFRDLVKLAEDKKWKVFFLGGKGIKNVVAGPALDNEGKPLTEKDKEIEAGVIQKINEEEPDLLFVGFGMPKQEKWIAKNLMKLKIGGAMAVGGTFDYVFGKAKLPPTWMEKIGLEWIWRLIREPKRIKRILNAVVGFPLLLIFKGRGQ
jgi:N-acetylglucosaminyldiphosphoundecaprenol N-acetyl-beta-D-mannosaminyltransferase